MSVTLRSPVVALLAIAGTLAVVTPTGADERFDPSFEVSLKQPAPQAPSELTLSLRLESGYQTSTLVFYIPLDWGVARGDQIPTGAKMGAIDSTGTYGLINSSCIQSLPITFELFNASIDPSQTVSLNDTDETPNMSTPSEEGAGGDVFYEESRAPR